jgi:hypothetical protein
MFVIVNFILLLMFILKFIIINLNGIFIYEFFHLFKKIYLKDKLLFL